MPGKPPGRRPSRRYDPSRVAGSLEARWSASSVLSVAGIVPLSLIEGLPAARPSEVQPSSAAVPHPPSEAIAAGSDPQPIPRPSRASAGRATPEPGAGQPLASPTTGQDDGLIARLFAANEGDGPARVPTARGGPGGGGAGSTKGGAGSQGGAANQPNAQPLAIGTGGAPGGQIGVLASNALSTDAPPSAGATPPAATTAPAPATIQPAQAPDTGTTAASMAPTAADSPKVPGLAGSTTPGSSGLGGASNAAPQASPATAGPPKLHLNLNLNHHLGDGGTPRSSSPLGTAQTGLATAGISPSTNPSGRDSGPDASGSKAGLLPGTAASSGLGSSSQGLQPASGGSSSTSTGPGSPTGGAAGSGDSAGFAAAFARPLGDGAGGLVERAWNYRQGAPYTPPDGSGHGAADGGDTAYQTLDALITQYVDSVLTPGGSSTGSLASGPIERSDGVGSFTFNVAGSYSIDEATVSGTFTANDSASFSYSLHETGTLSDESTFTLDDSGWASYTSIGGGSTDSHYLIGDLSGADSYTLIERQTLTGSSSLGESWTSFGDTTSSSDSGNDSFTYSEDRIEFLAGGAVTSGAEGFTFDQGGTDDPSVGEVDTQMDSLSGSVSDLESSSDTETGADGHSLHLSGSDALSSSAFFTSGNRTFTWNEQDHDTSGGGDGEYHRVIAPGGSDIETDYGTNTGGDYDSVYQSGTLEYAATGGSNFTWNPSGTYAYTTTDTTSETVTDHSTSTDSESLAWSTDSASSTESSTATDTDHGWTTESLSETGTQSFSSEAVAGGTDGYQYGETDYDTDSLTEFGGSTSGEDGTETEIVGFDVAVDTSGGGASTSSTDYDDTTDTPTFSQSNGSDSFAYGGAVVAGSVTDLTSETGVLGDDELHETDVNTPSGTGWETDTVDEVTSSMTSTEGGTDTDTIIDTENSTSGDGETETDLLGAGAVLIGGTGNSHSAEIDTDHHHDLDIGFATTDETDSEQSTIGSAFETDVETDLETDFLDDGDSKSDSPTTYESGSEVLAAGGAILSGSSSSSLYDLDGIDRPSGTDTIVDQAWGSGTETDVVGGDTTTVSSFEQGNDVATDIQSGYDVVLYDNASGTEWMGAGGNVTSGFEDSSSSEIDADTDSSPLDVGTDTTGEEETEDYLVDGDSLSDYASDGQTIIDSGSDGGQDFPTTSEWGYETVGIGGVALPGSKDRTSVTDYGYDDPCSTVTDIDSNTVHDNESDVAGEDTIWTSENDEGSGVDTTTESGDDAEYGTETTSNNYGYGGVLASAVQFSSEYTSGFDTENALPGSTEVETIDEGGSEVDQEAEARATDDQHDEETDTESIISSAAADYPTATGTAYEIQGAGGYIVGGNDWSTDYDFNDLVEDTRDSGGETFGDTSSESLLDGTSDGEDEEDDAPTDDSTGGYNTTDAGFEQATAYESDTDMLGGGGFVASGSVFETDYETGNDTTGGSSEDTDTSNSADHQSYPVGASNQSENSTGNGESTSSLGDGGVESTTVYTTTSESLGYNASIANGNESFSTYEYSSDSPSADLETTTSTETISYTNGDNPTATITSTETVSDTPTDETTLTLFGTESLGSFGSITDGSQTQTLDTWNTDHPVVVDGTGTEQDTDTSSTLTGTWTPAEDGGSYASLHEEETDTLGLMGSIIDGEMGYHLDYGSSDTDIPVEVGQEKVAGQVGEPAATADFSLTEPASFSYSSGEDGSDTLGDEGTIVSGSDSYVWLEDRSTGVQRDASGASIDIDEDGLDSYSLDETGTEYEGEAGSVTSGSDDFTWDQFGDDDYILEQEGATSATGAPSYDFDYDLSVNDSVSASWYDVGRDDLGESDSILGGSDDYDRHQTRDYSYGLGYGYTSFLGTSSLGGGSGTMGGGACYTYAPGPSSLNYLYDGDGTHDISFDDWGRDTLSDDGTEAAEGSADGSDTYTLYEVFRDSTGEAQDPAVNPPGNTNFGAIASDSFTLSDSGGDSEVGDVTLASHVYSVSDAYGEAFDLAGVEDFSTTASLGDTVSEATNFNDEQTFSYGLLARGSDAYSDGEQTSGSMICNSTTFGTDSYHAAAAGNILLDDFPLPNEDMGSVANNAVLDVSQTFETVGYEDNQYSNSYTSYFVQSLTSATDSANEQAHWGPVTQPFGTTSEYTYLTHGDYTDSNTAFQSGGAYIYGDSSDPLSYVALPTVNHSTASVSGTDYDSLDSAYIEKAQYSLQLTSPYPGLESAFFNNIMQRLNYAMGAGAVNHEVVVNEDPSTHIPAGSLGDPSGTLIIPSFVVVYRRGEAPMVSGGGTGTGYSAINGSMGAIKIEPRTGSGTEDGLPAEESHNLDDFLLGTDRAETASGDSPTTRADQAQIKPFQDFLKWGVSGSGGDGDGDGGGGSGGGTSGLAPGATGSRQALGAGAGSSPPPADDEGSSPGGANSSWMTALVAAGAAGSIFGYAGQVSDSIAMIDAAPQADSIATAGTEDDTSVVEDPNGDVTSEANPLGDATSFAYDGDGERTAVTDALGNVTRIAYDASGDVVSVTDPDGNTTTYDYDDQGRLIRMTDPLGHSATYAYDAAGLLASTTDRDGRRRDFSYNAAGQIVAEDWYDADGKLVDELRFDYDSAGRLTYASSDEGTYTFTYDAAGQLVRETEPFGLWLAFSYDDAGDRTGVRDSFGGDTVSTYNAAGQLVSRQLAAPGQLTIGVSLAYTADGEVDTLTRTAGGSTVGSTDDSYDASGDLTGIAHLDASGDVLDGFVYAYDAAGLVTSESDFGQAENPMGPVPGASPTALDAALLAGLLGGAAASGDDDEDASSAATAAGGSPTGFTGLTSPTDYTYDADGQLVAAGSQTYQYDANGNRINPGYVIGPDNQLLSDGTWDYTYDADGNEVGKLDIATGVSWAYAYDDANQMTSATEYAAGGKAVLAQVTYAYDVFGDRLQQTTYTASTGATTVQRYGYDGQDVWADLNGSNQLETRYLDGDAVDQILARVGAGGVVAWYLTDRLGSVRDLMGDSGAILDHRAYDAFGNITYETNPAAGDRYGYTGREFNITTGLQYNRARYYDPSIGRWTSQDPMGINAWDTNLQGYVHNDPVDNIDQSGLFDDPLGDTDRLFGGGISKGTRNSQFGAVAGGILVTQSAVDGFMRGLETSGKAGVNGLATAVRDTVTFGLVDGELQLIAVNADDLANGYDASRRMITASTEFLMSAASGGAASVLSKGGKIAKAAGGALVLLDAAGNVVGVAKGAQDIAINGVTFGNSIQVAGNALGLGVNARSLTAPKAAGLSCFPAGTLVATIDGLRPIESITEGDRVWSFDLVSSEWLVRPVLRTYSRPCKGNATSITVAGEVINSTSRHPYFVISGNHLDDRPTLEHLAQVPKGATTPGRWVDAGDLRIGDELLLLGGRIERIEQVRLYAFYDTVYNFEVDDLHCYAVGRSSVLVHNNNGQEGVRLTAAGRRKIGNLEDIKDVDAAQAILDRGGNAGNVRKALGDRLKGKTVGEIANLAAQEGPDKAAAETAMKIIKQAKKKGDKY